MKELMNEEYRHIAQQALAVKQSGKDDIFVGRAAYAASFPYAVAEALEEPSNEELVSPYSWHEGNKSSVRSIFAKRLARLAAKQDPAVEAIWQKLRMQNSWPHPDSEESQKLKVKAQEIVALVRSADGAK